MASWSFTPISNDTIIPHLVCTAGLSVGRGYLHSGAIATGDRDWICFCLDASAGLSMSGRAFSCQAGSLLVQWTQNVFLNDSGLGEGLMGL